MRSEKDFKKLNILDEKEKLLRMKSKEVVFPLTDEDKELIERGIQELTYSQIEKYEKKYDLRFRAKPGEKQKYTGRILAVGIGYEKEKKKHSCKVEVL